MIYIVKHGTNDDEKHSIEHGLKRGIVLGEVKGSSTLLKMT